MSVCVGWCWTAPRELLLVDSWGTARVCGRSTVRISSSSFVSIVKCLYSSFGNRTVWKCVSSLRLTLLEEFSCRKWFTGKWRSDRMLCGSVAWRSEPTREAFSLYTDPSWNLGVRESDESVLGQNRAVQTSCGKDSVLWKREFMEPPPKIA
jgi:hypothetical protein